MHWIQIEDQKLFQKVLERRSLINLFLNIFVTDNFPRILPSTPIRTHHLSHEKKKVGRLLVKAIKCMLKNWTLDPNKKIVKSDNDPIKI